MAKSFSSRMRAIGDLVTDNAQGIIRKAAMACTEEVVTRTPVKTGNARINWRVSFGKPSTRLMEAPNSDNLSTNANVAATQALIDAANKISRWKIGSGNIYIGNPVAYILELDRGSSRQAMEGMSIFGIEAAKAELRKGKLLRGKR